MTVHAEVFDDMPNVSEVAEEIVQNGLTSFAEAQALAEAGYTLDDCLSGECLNLSGRPFYEVVRAARKTSREIG